MTTGPNIRSGQTVNTSGSGLVFENSYDSSDGAAFMACVVAAERTLESLFTNTITIKLSFKEADKGKHWDALRNSWSSSVKTSYARLKSKLPAGDSLPSKNPDTAAGSTWSIPEAYARMLGLSSRRPTIDDSITLNTDIPWTFGQDVINGLIHEITEGGMGRVGGFGKGWGAMDLFRYSAPGVHDYTDGTDGKKTYFSSDGVNLSSAVGLSFHNQYDSSDARKHSGDTADWDQYAVFGATKHGETLSLMQTELNVMAALGWHTALPQDVLTDSADNWETPADWSNGCMPISPEDAFIGVLNACTVTSESSVRVNSIGTNSASALIVGDSSVFTATDGTVLSASKTFSWATGNLRKIEVDVGSALRIGDAFVNSGSTTVGLILSGAGGTGYLELTDRVKMKGGGTLTLGQQSNTFHAFSAGAISGAGMVNENNTIAGGGSIDLTSLDNQTGGVLEATQSEGNALQINVGTFTNEGEIVAQSRTVLDLGEDGATRSLTNTGTITLDDDADLAISGAFTVSAGGSIRLTDPGAEIISDGAMSATFTNAGSIQDTASGQIGDVGALAVNDLTFDNSGKVIVTGFGVSLTINTGGDTVGNGGGTLEAEGGAVLNIDSAIHTGELRSIGSHAPPGGAIEAGKGGTVELAASVSDGIPFQFFSVSGQIDIASGTFDMLAGSSVSVPINFADAGGELILTDPGGLTGNINGFDAAGANDKIDVAGSYTFTGFTENAGHTAGTLNFVDGNAHAGITLVGNYSATGFADNAGTITYS